MDSSPIDLDRLLAPLPAGSNGAGTDLRADFSATSIYQKLRDARSEARAFERRRDQGADASEDGSVETNAPVAEAWRVVLAAGQEALAGASKDFEVAAWTCEALVRLHGFEGLTAASRLIKGLCEAYWDDGFPQPDEDGLEGRAAPLGGLAGAGADGTVMQPLRMLPIFHRADGTAVNFYLWNQAVETAGLSEEKQAARHQAGVPQLKALEAEALLDRSFLLAAGQSAAEALAAWRDMDSTLSERLGSSAPSLRKVATLLEQIGDMVRRLGGAPLQDSAVPGGEPAAEGPQPVSPAAAGDAPKAPAPGALRSREDALRELNRIAEYFRRTEPHSPLAYTLEEAVRRGRMTLSELLLEVLPNEEARQGMLARLGMRPEGS